MAAVPTEADGSDRNHLSLGPLPFFFTNVGLLHVRPLSPGRTPIDGDDETVAVSGATAALRLNLGGANGNPNSPPPSLRHTTSASLSIPASFFLLIRARRQRIHGEAERQGRLQWRRRGSSATVTLVALASPGDDEVGLAVAAARRDRDWAAPSSPARVPSLLLSLRLSFLL
ncbi:uncharacterized protein LOC110266235 [Arachis ipaensis]|uniref:uncharacterized protein LOC110266235 n=1 Tax=Arachis ipaensis TaxID=130454 RepID=UPI000A2B533B|nr:uncharacterized protein LOC110266235 [Arachis ipaensis]